MARIEIKLPEKFIFTTTMPVLISDINRGRHLGHDRILPLLEETRSRLLKSMGYVGEAIEGTGFIMVDAGIIYKKQGFWGQTLKIELGITDITSKSIDIIYRISNAETGEEMFRAKTGMLFFDYRNQKVASVPGSFKQKVAEMKA